MDSDSDSRREKSALLHYKPGSADEGWYLVSVCLHGAKLGIHYECLPEKSDEEMALSELRSVEDLYCKFRLPSTQLKDNQCQKLIPKWPLVVSYSPAGHGGPLQDAGYQYFDARLEKKIWSKHISANGEKKCMCTFQILWLAGPNVGQSATVSCEQIHLLQFGRIEKHSVLKEAATSIRAKKYFKSQGTSDTDCSSLLGPANTTNVWKKFCKDKDRVVIVEDENGYLLCSSTSKASDY